jgi:hypothetical protein
MISATRQGHRLSLTSSEVAALAVSPTSRYHPFGGEVEALNTPTIRRLTPSCRHQLSALAQRADDFDCAVIIFAADDTAEIKGKKCLIARDNTVLEYGFFSARLGRKRTFVLVPDIKDLRVPSDMHGLTLIRYPAKLSPASMDGDLSEACKQLRAAIAGVEPRSEANDLSESMVIVLAALADDKNTDEAGDTLARFDAAPDRVGRGLPDTL